ncbi:MAG: hypothetical protein AAB974_00520 [Patescibacteria group bacterium]
MHLSAFLKRLFSNQRGMTQTATKTKTQTSTRVKVAVTVGMIGLVAAAAYGFAFAPGFQARRLTKTQPLAVNLRANTNAGAIINTTKPPQTSPTTSTPTDVSCGKLIVRLAPDTPSGTTASAIQQKVAKFILSAPTDCDVTVTKLVFNASSTIVISTSTPRNLEVFKGLYTASTLIGRQRIPTGWGRFIPTLTAFTIPAGASEAVIVTADTVDARTDNQLYVDLLSISTSPILEIVSLPVSGGRLSY